MIYYETDYLAHHGVKGQKWGVRRYQNKDGSLTSDGKKKYHSKLEKKRKRLSSYARDNSSEHKMLARTAREERKNIEKYGFSSREWKEKVKRDLDREQRAKELDASWNGTEKPKDPRSKTLSESSVDDLLNTGLRYFNKQDMDDYVSKLRSDEQRHINRAKAWEKTASDLMNYKISDLNTKADYKKEKKRLNKIYNR